MPAIVPTAVSLKNILVATDFSPCSEAVLPYARSLARQFDSTLFLGHVISTEILGIDPFQIEAAEASARRLMDSMEASGMFAGVRHQRLLEEGDTWSMLSKMIRENDIDLIVVGTHGRTGFQKLVMGSVAEEIFRHAPCPVLTIGPKVFAETKRDAHITHVLFATDLKAENPGPVDYALALAHEHQAHLTLMHVAESNSRVPVPQRLLELVPPEVELYTPPEAIIEIGDAAEKIVEMAANRHADIIVLGAHRPAIMTTHLMDVAYKVVVEASCPVLTVGPAFER